jgi:hypothetical protein
MGAAVAYQAPQTSESFWGVILVDDLLAGGSHATRNGNGKSWVYHVLSLRSQLAQRVAGVAQDAAPMLCVIAEHDSSLACMKAIAITSAAAHQAEIYVHPGDIDDLVTTDACSQIVREWCFRQLSNHFNPRWTAA